MDTVSIFFYANWCNPCKRVKPLYFHKIQPMYIMNGITSYEYDYDAEETKVLMEKFGVKTIPTLCIIHLSKTFETPEEIEESSIVSITKMDSHEMERKWDEVLLSFSTEEDF
jgi:thiol:disulfide interchange protein